MLLIQYHKVSLSKLFLIFTILLELQVLIQGQRLDKLQRQYLRLFQGTQPVNARVQPTGCERGTFYASFNPECQKEVAKMINQLQKKSDPTSLLNLAAKFRDLPTTHPRAWYTALTIVTMERPELRSLTQPHPVYVIPDAFFKLVGLNSASSADTRKCMDERIGQDNGIENKLWYFREDFQVNAHHFLWHLTYPSYLSSPVVVPHADRRGELFYYMHHSMMARYQTERLCNGLDLIPPFNLQHGYVMKDAYDSHLNDSNSGTAWAPRKANTLIPEVISLGTSNGRVVQLNLSNTIQDRDHLYKGIDNGFFINTVGQQIPLNNFDGIDQITCTTEASNFSVNVRLYGNVHNDGHNLIAHSHDPLNETANPQVMFDNIVNMRDPIFYSWHVYIDSIFNRHKDRLPKYQLNQGNYSLLWESVSLRQLDLNNSRGGLNTINTFWSYRNLTLNRGLDLDRPNGSDPVNICVKHLNHEEFSYNLEIYAIPTRFPMTTKATARIYLAPKYSVNGKPLSMEEQRLLFFILDTFTITLTPGLNKISQPSSTNALTVPWAQPVDLLNNQPVGTPLCGCGWPHHLLIPKGTTSGMEFELFAIVSNEELLETTSECKSAYLYCGVPGKRYPELKPMGWPFDRKLFDVIDYDFRTRALKDLDELVKYVPNSKSARIIIRHEDKVKVFLKKATSGQ